MTGPGPLARRARFPWEREAAGSAHPPWADTFAAMVAAWSTPEGDAPAGASHGLPYAHLLLPWVRVARIRLEARLRRARYATPMTAASHAALEHQLLLRLVETAAPTLQHEFEAPLAVGTRLLQRLGPLPVAPGRDRYREFIARQRSDGGRALFERYPVLARLLSTLVDQWVDNTETLVLDLAHDRDRLTQTFSPHGDIGAVTAIRTGLSDPHCGGRTTLLLHFASGAKLYYKPRSLEQDLAFNALLQWCNAEGAPLSMRGTTVLDCGDHGFSAHVEHRGCADHAALGRYYRRCGQLLALLHLLRGLDAHVQNLIADGEHPVLVDLETLAHPELRSADGVEPDDADSVLRTGLLPTPADRGADWSGLASWRAEGFVAPVTQWHAINTDAMHRRAGSVEPRAANLPSVANAAALSSDFLADLDAGYTAMARFLADRRRTLQRRNGPLAPWRSLRVRFILRDTAVYGALLRVVAQPQALRDGASFGAELDRLALDPTHPASPLVDAERIALARLDVPLFGARTDDFAVDDAGAVRLPALLRNSAWSDIEAQVARLGEPEIERQREAIRTSLATRRVPAAQDGSSQRASCA